MKKTGPCCHCGVASTPLWRNGPPDKPILCNACGSRWRTKGSLTNYTPLHVREASELEELKAPKEKGLSSKPKVQKLHKKKQNNMLDNEHELQYCDQNYKKMVEGDASRRSSCGPASSAMSYSESCAQFVTNDASDITGSVQSNIWDPLIPYKKSAFANRPKPSPVEILTKELYSIWHEQRSCNLSECSEDDLLYESATPLLSEIGYGSVLIRHPCSKSFEAESEVSSLPLEKKVYKMGETTRVACSNLQNDKLNKSTEEMVLDNAKRSTVPCERHRVLRDRGSPLVAANLTDVVNFEAFMKFLSLQEQQQLMKYLPTIDTSQPPESIKNMFKSRHFLEMIPCFQHLLEEGVFDLSFTLANVEECRNLRSYILDGLKKSEWVEYHKSLKDESSMKRKEKKLSGEENSTEVPKLASMKRSCDLSCDPQTQIYSDMDGALRIPKRVRTFEASNTTLTGTDDPSIKDIDIKYGNDINNLVEDEGTCSSPRSYFVSPQDSTSMKALQFTADCSDQDLLLDMPSSASFAEAELLYPLWKEKIAAHGPALDSGLAEREESHSSYSIIQANNV